MKIHKLLRKGLLHKEFCEDFCITLNLENTYFTGIVGDGCSSGKDSHFASALITKLLQNSLLSLLKDKTLSFEELFQKSIFLLFRNLKAIADIGQFQKEELLSTLLFLLINTENKAKVIAIGDGFISCNQAQINIDHQNKPDYLTYHYENLQTEDNFNKWFSSFKQIYTFENVKDISICSDGILSFSKDGFSTLNIEDIEKMNPVKYLTEDNFLINNEAMLARKLNILKNKESFVHLDDLSIVRVVLE